MLSLERLDLLLESHLDGLHHSSILRYQRGLTQNTRQENQAQVKGMLFIVVKPALFYSTCSVFHI